MKKVLNWLSNIRAKLNKQPSVCYRVGDNPPICPDGVITRKKK